MFRLALAAATTVALLPLVMTQSKQIVNVGPPPIGPYSAAVKAGGLIYLSGTLAQDDKGLLVSDGDAAAQTRRIIDRQRDVLAAAGSSLDQVVAVTVYLKSAADFQSMNDAYRSYWPKDPPTRTTVITDLLLGADVEISMIAVPAGAERTIIHPAEWVKSPNPYSYAIKTGDLLFLSGLVSRNGRDNSVVAGDLVVQMTTVMNNAATLLKAAGMDFSNVVSAKVYLTDTAHFPAMNARYREYFAGMPPPARATVKAGLAGPDYVVEIAFIASSAAREAITPVANLSAAIKSGNRLFVSGTLAVTNENAGNTAAQTREVLARIGRTMEPAGFSPSDVVDSLVYLTDLSQFQQMNGEYRSFFGKDFPARSTVGTALMANEAVVEIMVTAVRR